MIDETVVMFGEEIALDFGIQGENSRRLTCGLAFNLAGLIYYGAFVRRNPFLAECLVRQSLGYIAQPIQILRKDDRRDNPSPQVGKA